MTQSKNKMLIYGFDRGNQILIYEKKEVADRFALVVSKTLPDRQRD